MNLSCNICIKTLNLFADVFSTPCGHLFHKQCLDHWLQRSQTCPQCRFSFAKESVHKVFFNVDQCNEICELHYGNEREELEAKANATQNEKYKDAQDKIRSYQSAVDAQREKLSLLKIEIKNLARTCDFTVELINGVMNVQAELSSISEHALAICQKIIKMQKKHTELLEKRNEQLMAEIDQIKNIQNENNNVVPPAKTKIPRKRFYSDFSY